MHYENAQHDKAAKSTVQSYGHVSLVKQAQQEDVRHRIDML